MRAPPAANCGRSRGGRCLIATFGPIENSVVIIGAMVIAPLIVSVLARQVGRHHWLALVKTLSVGHVADRRQPRYRRSGGQSGRTLRAATVRADIQR